eukprot:574835-Rhodomonas_salina.2
MQNVHDVKSHIGIASEQAHTRIKLTAIDKPCSSWASHHALNSLGTDSVRQGTIENVVHAALCKPSRVRCDDAPDHTILAREPRWAFLALMQVRIHDVLVAKARRTKLRVVVPLASRRSVKRVDQLGA